MPCMATIRSRVGSFLKQGPRFVVCGLTEFKPTNTCQFASCSICVNHKIENRTVVGSKFSKLSLIHDGRLQRINGYPVVGLGKI